MSCTARVVVQAVVQVDIEELKKKARELKWEVVPDPAGGYSISITPQVSVRLKDKNATFLSFASDWDTGVSQIKTVIGMFLVLGANIEKVGRPETHIHKTAGPWQAVKH